MLDSQLEITQQAKQFLSQISVQDYTTAYKPHLVSSAGAHMRHILDHYQALKLGLETGLVDYNKRHRYSKVESEPDTALSAWQDIERWLPSACAMGEQQVQVVSETSVERTEYVQVSSTFSRELVFVSSHAIHHFSLMAVLRSLQGQASPQNFGVAPATASFLRQQA